MQDGQNEMPDPRSNGDDAADGGQATNGENAVTGKDRPANPNLIDIFRGKLRMLHYAQTRAAAILAVRIRAYPKRGLTLSGESLN